MKKIAFVVLVLCAAMSVWAGGEQEAAASTGRGKYLAGRGIIIPPEEVHVNSYIASVDYHYPEPEGDLGVTVYSGRHQLSVAGQEEVVHIGIQGKRLEFEKLPPMNLAFVIDKSGSMASANKMDWVKDAFDIFIEKVRDIDFVALIVFDNDAKVLFPSTQMESRDKRLQFQQAVHSIGSNGGTNLKAGLELGYQQVMANYRDEYTNRVLFLTDGVGESTGILEMAETYKEMNINVSTIGVGTNFDLELMVELSKRGGGSSRFISDREEMEETFGSELDRMVVPVARNLRMKLELLQPAEILGTWGYQNRIEGDTIFYSQETLHHRDYETILAHIKLDGGQQAGPAELARFSIEYDDLNGTSHRAGPFPIQVEFVDRENPVTGYSNGMVLQSGTMMRFARSLETIGKLYYSCRPEIDQINQLRDDLWEAEAAPASEEPASTDVVYEELSSPEIRALEEAVNSKMKRAIDLTSEMKKEMENVKVRLDNQGFDDEIGILDNYIKILGRELEWEDTRVVNVLSDVEITPPEEERSLEEHLQGLFFEMTYDLKLKDAGAVAISGFVPKSGEPTALVDLLNEMAVTEIGQIETLTLVERERMNELFAEQKLSLSGMADTSTAIEVGKMLAARYLVTGSIIEMSSSVVIFGRIINVESGEIESAAQVIVRKSRELQELLKA